MNGPFRTDEAEMKRFAIWVLGLAAAVSLNSAAFAQAQWNYSYDASGNAQAVYPGGVLCKGATGGSQGPNTLNCGALYINGVAVSAGAGTPGGTSGQVQYNNAGAFGGFTMAGDCTLAQPNITCTKTGGVAFAPSATTDTTNASNITSGTLVVNRAVERSYLAGLTLSTAGGSTTFGIAVGAAADSTNTAMMAFSSAYTKTTGAWTLGTGGGCLVTGTIANSTWYSIYEIERPDTGVVDVECDLNAITPTLPTNYTLFRRIGSMLTNGSAQWVQFTQNGDEFLWNTPTLDISATANLPTTAVTETLNDVPTGVVVNALLVGAFGNTGAAVSLLISALATADVAPAVNGLGMTAGTAATLPFGQMSVRTNTTQQIRVRITGNANSYLLGTVQGWIDRRGRDN